MLLPCTRVIIFNRPRNCKSIFTILTDTWHVQQSTDDDNDNNDCNDDDGCEDDDVMVIEGKISQSYRPSSRS